ncbi:alpha-glucosidase/alpha-galactosidase [Acetatifactor muris]|uniref:Alpha-galactosidase n=1 Tax=Acetatifactor muris TaxID=879566 RepID=A0A2K4ZJ15_9FIRM|nr:alpha-glucosidase/alpha-galactosidase [Acetatifactor muris]MCI8800001.1 alpha-glucosidase/alpha-galactosidase [Lachnospiraceae bacterium]MCR2045972.1 alpha-glucosidase/alpha-galactosidase [Acetatifactor muris]SOY30464.1 Alpha-galactosidase [Acetatifactor muris]
MKITFMGAGSTVFARNVIGDCMCSDALKDSTFALYDINGERLKESQTILEAMRKTKGGHGKIECYLGVEQRREALRGASFVVNAIQVGLYDPCTITDFEIPKKFGLRQTIGDTLGIGGIMRALRTIPVMEEFARDMADVCPDALFLNYTNPMAMLTGYMLRYTPVKTVGLCHSVQVCSEGLLKELDMADKLEGRRELIAGINHMAWLLELKDRDNNDLYPEIKKRAAAKMADPDFKDKVRLDYINHFGYYCTESSEHNAEYNTFYIKSKYPELIERYNIPLDEYPRRCVDQIESWKKEYAGLLENGVKDHERSREYASHIMESIVTGTPYQIGGNVLNTDHLISNLPEEACVEVPCLVNGHGVHPCHVGPLPVQCAAMNMTNINVQLLTIEAAHTHKLEHIYQAAMLDPHTAGELDIDSIRKMVDELIAAHGDYLPRYH